MTPAVETALAARRVMIVWLTEIILPDHTIRLADGSIAVDWAGNVFAGSDPTYGAFDTADDVSEAVGDSAPGGVVTLNVPTIAAAVALCQSANQGAAFNIYEAVVDYDTGEVVPDPDLQFAGEIDTADLLIDVGSQKVQMGIGSVWDRLLEADEGARLSDSFQKSIFPGDMGLANMSGTLINELWGPGERPPAATQPPAVSQAGANRYF